MKSILFLFLLLPVFVFAQEDMARYLEGAVPVVDGKVIFKNEIQVAELSQDEIYTKVLEMANKRFVTDAKQKGRIIYTDEEKGIIVCWGEEYIIFTQKALALDQSLINYQATYTCENGSCEIEVSRIRYQYDSDQRKNIYAEDWITDEHAFDKKRNRLNRVNDKFRIKTIDLVDDLTELCWKALQPMIIPQYNRGVATQAVPAQPTTLPKEVPQVHVNVPTTREGYTRLIPTRISGNFVEMLMSGRITIVNSESPENNINTQWGGCGYLFNKPVVYTFVVPSRETLTVLENKDTYTLVWTPNNSNDSSYKEIIFECRKIVSQSISLEALSGDDLKMEWSDKALPKLFTGEILEVWVK